MSHNQRDTKHHENDGLGKYGHGRPCRISKSAVVRTALSEDKTSLRSYLTGIAKGSRRNGRTVLRISTLSEMTTLPLPAATIQTLLTHAVEGATARSIKIRQTGPDTYTATSAVMVQGHKFNLGEGNEYSYDDLSDGPDSKLQMIVDQFVVDEITLAAGDLTADMIDALKSRVVGNQRQ